MCFQSISTFFLKDVSIQVGNNNDLIRFFPFWRQLVHPILERKFVLYLDMILDLRNLITWNSLVDANALTSIHFEI